MIASRGRGRPSVTIGAKCPVLSKPPAPLVIIPVPAFPLSCSSIVLSPSSLCISLHQSLSFPGLTFSFMFVSHAADSFVTPSLFSRSKPIMVHKDTSDRVTLPSSVPISLRGRQAHFVPGTICIAPAFRSATNREGGKWSSDSFFDTIWDVNAQNSLTGRISSSECKYSFSWTWILNYA